MPQAAATLAAASVGLSIGLFDQVVLNAVLVVVVLSLLISSATTQVFAGRVAVPHRDQRPIGQRVLVGLADDAQSGSLLPLATALARADAGTVDSVHIIADEITALSRPSPQLKAALAASVAAAGAEGEAHVRLDQSTALGLRNAAIETDASVLVVGNRLRKGLTGWFRDRAVEQVVAASPVPVIVGVSLPRVRRVVVTVDAADTLDTAVIDAVLLADIAGRLRAQWHCAVMVVAGPDVPERSLAPFGDARVVHVRQAPAQWLQGEITGGDLVLGATGPGAALIDAAHSRLTQTPGVGLAIVAGPGQAGTGFAPGVPSPFVDD